MRLAVCLAFGTALSTSSGLAMAQEHPPYQSLWDEASHDPGCSSSEYVDLVLVKCDRGLTLWYFTKPNHPAHPGVIKRTLTQKADGAWIAQEQGSSFAADDAQPAFNAWLAQIQDLDRQMMESIQKQRNTHPPTTSN
ncbi:MAG TPA: hypothetical protein VGJ75_10605 [Dongiaceae bacterium]|jgi:hypothetical protein